MARRRIRTLYALPLCLALGGILVALPGARAETLETAVLEAVNHHPGVNAALAARDAAIESRNEAFSSFFPQLRASAAVGRVYGNNSTSRGLSRADYERAHGMHVDEHRHEVLLEGVTPA